MRWRLGLGKRALAHVLCLVAFGSACVPRPWLPPNVVPSILTKCYASHVEGQLDSGDDEFSLSRHIGEYLREASVLFLVFGFLDPLIPQVDKPGTVIERMAAIPSSWVLLVVLVSVGCFIVGILLEWLRKR